ncbi:MAG: hypothetical protein IJS80_05640 [Lachnospiraceae bacterium]|nr:hypothetical protein [Lachnospiraceae bacterium]
MKKRITAMLIAGIMVLSLTACGNSNVKINQRTRTSTRTKTVQTAKTDNNTNNTAVSTPTPTPVSVDKLTFSEAPELKAKVSAGTLPAVEKRIPDKDNVFIAQTDAAGTVLEIGTYGGNYSMTLGGGSWDIARPVLESIIRYNTDGTYVPNVIKSFEHNSDYTVWTFHLRKGMKWSDGDDFTADDITFWYYMVHINNYDSKASWEALKDGKTGNYAMLKKVDDLTVTWTFDTSKYPGSFIENGDFKWCWAPSHYLMDLIPSSYYVQNEYWKDTGLSDDQVIANAAAKGINYSKVKDIGKNVCYYFWNISGLPTVNSFVLTTKEGNNSRSAELCILERNPYYWKIDAKGNQLPYLDNIYLKKLGENDDAKAMLISGDLDRMDIGMEQVSSLMAELGSSAVLKTIAGSSWGSNQVTFNYTYANKNYADLFANSDFRQAMSICVDRDEVSLLTSEGFLAPGQCAPSVGNFGNDTEWSRKWTTYDVAAAQKLLQNCGLKAGSDGYLDFADGSDLSVDFVSFDGSADYIYSILKRYYDAIHIKTTLTNYDVATYDKVIDTNDWVASMCPHMSVGGFSLKERAASFVPIAQAAEWYGDYGTYYTDHTKGVAPTGDMAKLVQIYEQWTDTADSAKRDELALQIYELHKKNLWSIAYSEGANTYCLISPKLHNFADNLVSNDLYQYANIYHFETLFKK